MSADKRNDAMKKVMLIMIAILCIILFAGCGSGDKAGSKEDKEGWIHPPEGEMVGENYEDVIKAFEEAGFTNVKREKIEDFFMGLTNELGAVEEVTIDGHRCKADKLYDPAATVLVSYHTYESWDAYKKDYESNGWKDSENREINADDEEYFRSFIGKGCNEVIDSADDHDYSIFFIKGTTIRNENTDDVRRNPDWYVIDDLIYIESHDLIVTFLVSEDLP